MPPRTRSAAWACSIRPSVSSGGSRAEPSASSAREPAAAAGGPAKGAEPPTYDLDADVARRISEARDDFGPRTPTELEADVFVVVGGPGWGPGALAGSVALVRGALDAYFNG